MNKIRFKEEEGGRGNGIPSIGFSQGSYIHVYCQRKVFPVRNIKALYEDYGWLLKWTDLLAQKKKGVC